MNKPRTRQEIVDDIRKLLDELDKEPSMYPKAPVFGDYPVHTFGDKPPARLTYDEIMDWGSSS